jgi:cytochrome c oxidase subunit 3
VTARIAKPEPFADDRAREAAGHLGIWVFIASLVMLFGATVTGFIVIRNTDLAWPEDLPALPAVLWVSTLVLIVSSITMQAALNGIRRGDVGRLGLGLVATLSLGTVFLLLQAWSWWTWRASLLASTTDDEAQAFALSAFYVLTGVHGLHVIGGLVALTVVGILALRGVYTSTRHVGVASCTVYWHFLGVVWLFLFPTLLFGV